MASQGLPIGALARRSRCAIETIRYYERIGLLPPPDRDGRFRRYDRDAVARVAFVRRARELGFSLEQVRGLLRLAEPDAAGAALCGQARAIARAHLAEMRRRLADLRALIGALAEMGRACAASRAPECPMLTALFAPPGAA